MHMIRDNKPPLCKISRCAGKFHAGPTKDHQRQASLSSETDQDSPEAGLISFEAISGPRLDGPPFPKRNTF